MGRRRSPPAALAETCGGGHGRHLHRLIKAAGVHDPAAGGALPLRLRRLPAADDRRPCHLLPPCRPARGLTRTAALPRLLLRRGRLRRRGARLGLDRRRRRVATQGRLEPWAEARAHLRQLARDQPRLPLPHLAGDALRARVRRHRRHRRLPDLQGQRAHLLPGNGRRLGHDARRQRADVVAHVDRLPQAEEEAPGLLREELLATERKWSGTASRARRLDSIGKCGFSCML
mmetsp:Transcript_30711/g.72512  ORF Transcript_30711/g.72512 Transcript_30711/m.72512 type:complete len:231 (+) Transcript_30711:321-1013(+)